MSEGYVLIVYWVGGGDWAIWYNTSGVSGLVELAAGSSDRLPVAGVGLIPKHLVLLARPGFAVLRAQH